jgi:hypothetical protein
MLPTEARPIAGIEHSLALAYAPFATFQIAQS